MLKKRVIATLIVKNNIVVQSINFNKYLPIGKPRIAIEFLNQWGVDEIIYLDIDATRHGHEPNFDLIKNIAEKCFLPLTIGGGIKNIDHIKKLMKYGADKISLNSILLSDIEFVKQTSSIFGSQCIVASVDVIKVGGNYEVFDYLNSKSNKVSIVDFVRQLEDSGIGEIFINSIDRDGTYKGFDMDLISKIDSISNVPVIICGGAKTPQDFQEVFENSNVSGAAAGNYFHFYEHSVTLTKSFLNRKLPIRLETNFDYHESDLSNDFRILKKEDIFLENMLFHKIENENI
jgi:cyclase